jgi:hypothetical protein
MIWFGFEDGMIEAQSRIYGTAAPSAPARLVVPVGPTPLAGEIRDNPPLALTVGRLLGAIGERLVEELYDSHLMRLEDAIKKGDQARVARLRVRFVLLMACYLLHAIVLNLEAVMHDILRIKKS